MDKGTDYQHQPEKHYFLFPQSNINDITDTRVYQYLASGASSWLEDYKHIVPEKLELNRGTFSGRLTLSIFPDVELMKTDDGILLSCTCTSENERLCGHQAAVLTAVMKNQDLRVFFDDDLRIKKLRTFAEDYGLQDEPDIESFFLISIHNGKLLIQPADSSVFPVTKESIMSLSAVFSNADVMPPLPAGPGASPAFVVLRQHKYYDYLFIELYQSELTRDGAPKNPLKRLSPLDLLWESGDHEAQKFFTALSKFQSYSDAARSEQDLRALKAIVKNPSAYRFYYHDKKVSENITARSLVPIRVSELEKDLNLDISLRDPFYQISGAVDIDGSEISVNDITIMFGWFILSKGTLYLSGSLQSIALIELLKKRGGMMLVHTSRYAGFRNAWLSKLEERTTINYRYLNPATSVQLRQQGFDAGNEKILFLSDFGQYVMIIPVLRYGEVEIPVRTKKPIYTQDSKGNEFFVKRSREEEDAFITLLARQHPWFEEQLDNDLYYFYLHKNRFLDDNWFLNVFEDWRQHGITILGFNEIGNNHLNQHKVKVNIKVLSGINWFDVQVNARFGKKRASLKQLFKAVKNKSKYVQLDDGTLGILPSEWIERFSAYFKAALKIDDEMLGIAKVNFAIIDELFEEDMLDEEVKKDLRILSEKLNGFEEIPEVPVPEALQGELREYQKHGLNWLCFLDNLGFGGCLADDMGLGKTIQIIAFILAQRERASNNTNLVVVPASLIFNWQREISRFAPSIKVMTIYGPARNKSLEDIKQHELVLTSYGTLLSDVHILKDFEFNYIFLDESQNIKNPGSQRYKAVRLLRSRNRIVITGTPVENNTFDLFAQMSFACPGLLGNRQYFKEIYSAPVDMFHNTKRSRELQNRINPFILRRTKQQVAPELPEKTEMVVYCKMGEDQRKTYEAFEKEFRDFVSATTDEEIKKSSMYVLRGLTRLRQICDSPLLIKGEKLKGNESAKILTLIEQIETKAPQHKILVFSQFVSMLDLIAAQLKDRNIGFVSLTGATRNREQVVGKFQDDPAIRVFLISLKAGGIGLNLTEADYVYLAEPWWNPAVESQAIDRSHRLGQNKKVVAVRLICPGTVEEKIMKLQESKKDLIDRLIKTESSFFKSLSKSDLLSLVS
ncbi:DEAD/DEAH box helicase [Pararcticibacter amylolyticus]|uniref:DNA helicase n=1 Tax=Pararcticibacter amylolyticus TaxID=2173175 RepID=A0A2U2PLB7_9SPHI|nr:SNF2-related protein [Pararcticibacter amylolyticus]PWG82191.1 DNA helicase [Pararcticibacter amylolyticus]